MAGTVKAAGIALLDSASGTALTVNGKLDAGAGTLGLQASNAGGAMSLAGTLIGGKVDLIAGSGGITQPSGSITATTLTVAVSGGNATLGQAGNSIVNLGNSTITGGSLTVVDSVALTVSGAIAADAVTLTDSAAGTALIVNGIITTIAGGIIALTASQPTGAIALAGVVNASASGILDLSAGGSVIQTGGSVTAGTLRSTAGIGGSLALSQPANAIGSITTLAVIGDAAITDSIALKIAGPLSAANLAVIGAAAGTAISVTGSASAAGTMTLLASDAAGGIALSGAIKANVLDLSAGIGGVSQSGGSIAASTLQSATGVAGLVSLDQAGNAIARLGNFAVSGGGFVLRDSIALDVTGTVSANSVALRSSAAVAKALTVSGTLSATADANLLATDAAGGIVLSGTLNAAILDVSAGTGGITQTAGTVTAATLRSAGGSAGTFAFDQPGNAIGSILDFKVTGGDFTLRNGVALSVQGPLAADNITLRTTSGNIDVLFAGISTAAGSLTRLDAAGAITLGSNVNATTTGIIDMTAGAGIQQLGSSILTAGTLRSSGGVTGSVSLGSANVVGTLSDFTVSGHHFDLFNTVNLKVAGIVSALNISLIDGSAGPAAINITGSLRASAGGAIVLAATGATGGMTLAGIVDATPTGLVDLWAGTGGVTQVSGSITAGIIQSNNGVTGAVALTQPGNAIATLGKFSAAGGVALADSQALTVAGPVTISAGNLTITNSAAGAGSIAVTGPVTVSGNAKLAASAPSGGITLGSALKATALDLAAGSAGVTQTGGALSLGTLTNSGLNGPVSLTQAANSIATISAFTVASGNIALVNATRLTIAGTLNAAQGGVTVTGLAADPAAINVTGSVASGPNKSTTLSAPNGGITTALGGQVAAPGGLLSLATLTGVSAPGTLAAGKLAVVAGAPGNVSLTGANAIGTLGSASLADGTFTLNNATPLTIAGPVTARLLGITAAGSITIANGVAFTTDGLGRVAQKIDSKLTDPQIAALTSSQLGSFLAIAGGGGPGKITIGNVTVAPFSASKATIDFVLPQPGAGTITIGQLVGRTTDLILVTRASGIVTGTVDVASLLVLGGGGKADLFGKLGGVDGQAAANKASISPLPNSDYRFNACPITSVNCVLLPVQTLPPISALRDVPIIRDRPTQDDVDVQLPNVSDEDY